MSWMLGFWAMPGVAPCVIIGVVVGVATDMLVGVVDVVFLCVVGGEYTRLRLRCVSVIMGVYGVALGMVFVAPCICRC